MGVRLCHVLSVKFLILKIDLFLGNFVFFSIWQMNLKQKPVKPLCLPKGCRSLLEIVVSVIVVHELLRVDAK